MDTAQETVKKRLQIAAHLDIPILFLGETGVGKEHTADRLQKMSLRNGKPYVKVNCVGFADTMIDSELFGHVRGAFTGALDNKIGVLEAAHGGTLFLDEIGDMPLDVQAKLLRFLQNGEVRPVGSTQVRHVNARLMFATRRNLEDEVRTGNFRDDLYYRIAEFPITVPPLRERKPEIVTLAEGFKAEAVKEFRIVDEKPFGEDYRGHLWHYRWPGNVRELRSDVRRWVLDF